MTRDGDRLKISDYSYCLTLINLLRFIISIILVFLNLNMVPILFVVHSYDVCFYDIFVPMKYIMKKVSNDVDV